MRISVAQPKKKETQKISKLLQFFFFHLSLSLNSLKVYSVTQAAVSSNSLNSSDELNANANSSSNFFSLTESDETPQNSPLKTNNVSTPNSSYAVSVDLHSPSSQIMPSSFNNGMQQRSRKLSNSSVASSDFSAFRLPHYESPPVSS